MIESAFLALSKAKVKSVVAAVRRGSTMKAILCKSHGLAEDLVLEEVDDPMAGENEAVVEVFSASLNFPDSVLSSL